VGAGGHPNYWSDGAIWNAIAFEVFNIGENRREEISSKTPARSLLESHLGTLLFTFTTIFSLVGVVGIWLIFVKR
jgi:hypothetical protein